MPISVGRIRIDPARYDVMVDGERVELTLMQFNLLKALARRPDWIYTPEQLSGAIPDRRDPITASSLKNQVYQLRRKLGPAAVQVQTVRGLGYRLATSSGSASSLDEH